MKRQTGCKERNNNFSKHRKTEQPNNKKLLLPVSSGDIGIVTRLNQEKIS